MANKNSSVEEYSVRYPLSRLLVTAYFDSEGKIGNAIRNEIVKGGQEERIMSFLF
jgi:hypothetical protein